MKGIHCKYKTKKMTVEIIFIEKFKTSYCSQIKVKFYRNYKMHGINEILILRSTSKTTNVN